MVSPLMQFDGGESKLELGPDLPMSVFTSTEPWNPQRIRALALYCSDGRWGLAFDEFCHKCLQIPRYDRWAVPGGAAWLVSSGQDDAFARAAREQLDFLVQVHELERVVLIAHYGCAAYVQGLQKSEQECLPIQAEDLRAAASALRRQYPQMAVEGYLAMRLERTLSFHDLNV